MSRPILVSACLLGINTRYSGRLKRNPRVLAYLETEGLLPIPVCPEQLGGLPTPRPKTCFSDGDGRTVLAGQAKLLNALGEPVNAAFLAGAEETWKIAALTGCRQALLKERSPSCGVHAVYQGEQCVPGMGVTAALLAQRGLEIFSEDDLDAQD